MKQSLLVRFKQVWLQLLLVVLLGSGAVIGSCRNVPENKVGEALAGPFDLVALPQDKGFLVLNSSFTVEYVDGSLLYYTVDVATGTPTKKKAYSIERLGSSMSLSPDGKILAVSFLGTESAIRFYDVSDPENIKALPLLTHSPDGVSFGRPVFFDPAGIPEAQNKRYLAYPLFPYSRGSKTIVLELTDTSSRVLFNLPDDLPAPEGSQDYTVGFSSPVYIASQKIFVAFPQGLQFDSNYKLPALGLPAVYDFLKSFADTKTYTEEGDLRQASLAVVDFEKFMATGNLAKTTSFAPLAYNINAQQGLVNNADPNDKSSPHNVSLAWQSLFRAAKAVNATGCYDKYPKYNDADTALPVEELPKDAVLVMDAHERVATGRNNEFVDSVPYREVVLFKGWASLKQNIDALPAEADGTDYRRRLVFPSIETSLYSRVKDIEPRHLDDNNQHSVIAKIEIMDTGDLCAPVWLRADQYRQSEGSEVSWIQTNAGRTAESPLTLEVDTEGSMAMAAVKNFIYTVSFSNNELLTYRYENDAFVRVK